MQRNLIVELRRRLLVAAVLAWMAAIAFLDYLTMMPGSRAEEYVENTTGIPFVAARAWFRSVMSAPLHSP
jgi:hypothetical protein